MELGATARRMKARAVRMRTRSGRIRTSTERMRARTRSIRIRAGRAGTVLPSLTPIGETGSVFPSPVYCSKGLHNTLYTKMEEGDLVMYDVY
jgi:hypothetical protein